MRPPAPRSSATSVDLNADLGEEVTDDSALLAVVTSANVACGYHAGGPATMRAVCAEAAGRGVAIGAQVSYADREHFGRVARDVAPGLLREQVADQVGMLADAARRGGTVVGYLKPHGALYHRVLDDPEQAAAVLDGASVDGVALPVLGMPGVGLELAAARGLATYVEGFPDRGYRDGRLVPRGDPGALLETEDAIVGQALRLAGEVASLCLHGDSPGAVGHARAVRAALLEAGFELASFLPRPATGPVEM